MLHILQGGPEIARLEKCVSDQDYDGSLEVYQKSKTKLSLLLPKRNKHHARYIFLKTKPELGETIVAYATRRREKSNWPLFW